MEVLACVEPDFILLYLLFEIVVLKFYRYLRKDIMINAFDASISY